MIWSKSRALLAALVASLVGWGSVAPWLEGLAIVRKFGYAFYCPLIAAAVWLFLCVGLAVRERTSGGWYVFLGVLWVLTGWIPAYFFAIAFSTGGMAIASSLAFLSFVPVGLPVAEMCENAIVAGTTMFIAILLFDVVRRARQKWGGL